MNQAFLSCLKSQPSSTSIPKQQLDQQIDETKQLLRKSFFSASKTGVPTSLEEFNFECYVHFKVFNEILIKQKVNFPPFRKDFESAIGIRLFQLALQQQPLLLPSQIDSKTLATSLQNALRTTDAIANLLQKKGLVTSWERSIPLDDDVEDFATTATSSVDNFSVSSDLPYSLALYGDATLNSQLLLQELGYRLYPSFGRWLVREGVSRCFGGDAEKKVGNEVVTQIDDYYMDTSYNSNPDLFEVKQVLLNIVIKRD